MAKNPSVPFNEQGNVTDVCVYKDTASLDLYYPRNQDVKYISVGLMDVRAADDIRISYDFPRDGWKIEQASRFSWNVDDEKMDADWQEVAFVQAWARRESEEEENKRLGFALNES